MHELSVCLALIGQLEEIARQRQARITEARVGIGPLSGIEPQLLAAAYPLACAGTVAEGSILAIEERPLRVRCRHCGAESDASPNRLLCGDCGDWHTDVIAGNEMLLLQVELEPLTQKSEAEHV